MSKREREESDISIHQSRRVEGRFSGNVNLVYRWCVVLYIAMKQQLQLLVGLGEARFHKKRVREYPSCFIKDQVQVR